MSGWYVILDYVDEDDRVLIRDWQRGFSTLEGATNWAIQKDAEPGCRVVEIRPAANSAVAFSPPKDDASRSATTTTPAATNTGEPRIEIVVGPVDAVYIDGFYDRQRYAFDLVDLLDIPEVQKVIRRREVDYEWYHSIGTYPPRLSDVKFGK